MILADHRSTASRKRLAAVSVCLNSANTRNTTLLTNPSVSTEVIVMASRRVQRWCPTNTDANNGISKTLTIASTNQLGPTVRFSDSTLKRIPITSTAIKKDHRGTFPAYFPISSISVSMVSTTRFFISLFQPNLSSTQYSVIQEHCTGLLVMQRLWFINRVSGIVWLSIPLVR